MRIRSLVILIVFFFACTVVYAQDKLPKRSPVEKPMRIPKQISSGNKENKILVGNSLPFSFKGTKENKIDNPEPLFFFFEQLSIQVEDIGEDTLRILHIGDSHVRGHFFPRAAGEMIAKPFGAVKYSDMGVNGATYLTFTHPVRIADIASQKPALLILSFGTNESHGRGYNPVVHKSQIDELVKLLRDSLPEVPMLLTTPPGSYESFRYRKRKRRYSVNPRTETAASVIRQYAYDNNLAVWDMYEIVGGKESACANWQAIGVMRPDHVHYTAEGYRLQGKLFYEAIIKAYNEYISR